MSAKIISVFNQKGGSGKTTTSMHIAGTLGMRGLKSLVVDMDPQGTASRWYSCATEKNPFPGAVFSLASMEGKFISAVKQHINSYDVIVIDCPPAINSPIPSSAMLVSDLAIIPIIPAPADLWAAVAAQELAIQAKSMNESLEVRYLPNMVQKKTKLAQEVLGVLGEEEQIPMLSAVGSRSAFRECQLIGSTVHSVPGAKAAIDEVETVVNEIIDILNQNKGE